jgi:hypothetical protein
MLLIQIQSRYKQTIDLGAFIYFDPSSFRLLKTLHITLFLQIPTE